MYIYIYIYILIYIYYIYILYIYKERNNFLSSILVVLLGPITFSLANCELNYAPFGVFGAFAPI